MSFPTSLPKTSLSSDKLEITAQLHPSGSTKPGRRGEFRRGLLKETNQIDGRKKKERRKPGFRKGMQKSFN